MRFLIFLPFVLISLTSASALAQELSDTIYFHKINKNETYDQYPTHLSSKIEDTLTLNESFVYREDDGEVRFLIKDGRKWVSWSLFENSSIGANLIDSIAQVKLGKGDDKLIVYWQFTNGRSSWESGFSESYKSIQVWDLENKTRLMELPINHDYEYWWTTFEEDPTDTIPYEEREVIESGGDSRLYNLEFRVEKKRIYVNETHNEENDQSLPLCSGEYVFEKDKFVLRNKDCK